MMTGQHYQRATILYDQNRYEQAIQELRQELAQSPDSVEARTLLALSLSALKQHTEALKQVRYAVQAAPDYDYPHYALASILFQQDRFRDAEAAIQTALRLNPEDADYYALHSNILLSQRQFPPCAPGCRVRPGM